MRLLAQRDVVSELNSESVRAVVDLSDVRGGTASVTLGRGHIERPRGVGVVNIVPRRIELKLAPARRSSPGKRRR